MTEKNVFKKTEYFITTTIYEEEKEGEKEVGKGYQEKLIMMSLCCFNCC